VREDPHPAVAARRPPFPAMRERGQLGKGDPVRFLLISGLLLGTAGCVWAPPQQQGSNCPYARAALATPPRPAPAPPPAAVAPAPPPAAAVAPPPPAAAAGPPLRLASLIVPIPFGEYLTPQPGRLVLSNYSFDLTDVEAFVTRWPSCATHPGIVPVHLKLPLNGTWTIATPPGSDVCWRRSLTAPPQPDAEKAQWTEWNRAFTSTGRSIDSQL
jgi:hypothetical protein